MKEKWFIKNKKADFELIASTHHIDPTLAQLIVNRGITSSEELTKYLNPTLNDLHNPLLMKDLDKACDILKDKIKSKKSIRVIGDYDVDGVMAAYLLVTGLRQCGAIVDYEIPDRIKDGYGINIDIIKAAANDKVDTILTCDNGIAANEQIAFAKEKGLTVIITDHHDIPIEEGVPKADAVVNPKQEDCQYPQKEICGALVAYKLVEVMYQKFAAEKEKLTQLLEFSAIATVCDVMDLCGENRIIVKKGLENFEKTHNIGLRALREACGLADKPISAYHFGFVIGPCINASGRLESAKQSLSLLLCEDKQKADVLAQSLKKLNDERKDMTAKELEKAIDAVENSDLIQDSILLVFLEGCHESLAGIIAGRLRERYNKPSIVLTNAEEGIKGSGRSIEEYHMFAELSKCKDLLNKFGGHPMAAGLSMDADKLEELRRRLNENTNLTQEDLLPKISFDMVLPFEKASISLVRQLGRLEPYGKGNVKPLFAKKDAIITNALILGANKNVLKLQLKSDSSNRRYTAMIFQNIQGFIETIEEKYGNGSFDDLLLGRNELKLDILFTLNINEYNGMENLQLIIQNYR